MTTEKLLEIVNTMIDNATDEQKDIIRMMRRDGLKDGKTIPNLFNAGIEMETLRNLLIEDLQAAEMKSCGKSKTFSAIKRYAKHCMKDNERKPIWLTSWKLKDGRYITTDGYTMLFTNDANGLILKENPNPEDVDSAQRTADRQQNNIYDKELIFPELGKIKAYMKRKKAENKRWKEPFVINNIGMNFDYVVYGMEITGSNVLHYSKPGRVMMLEGNGNTFLMMPIYLKEEKTDTNLD